MKKLLLITDAWSPQVNGVATSYENIRALLEKRGWRFTVVHPGLFKTVPLPLYPEIRLALFPRRRLRRIFERENPDAVHIPVPGPLGLAGRAICKARKIPFTTCYHTHLAHYTDVRFKALFGMAHTFLRWFHNSGAATMVATDGLKKELAREGFRNLVLWPLGVDTGLFKRNPSPPLPLLPKPVFVYFGRLAIEKNPEEFLALDLPGTKLVIGDGPDRKELEKKYGSSATFVGYKRGKELVEWLSLCDVFVFPSRMETLGLVVLEALACGIPVVAHNVMGPRDIIENGVDGILSENLGEAALAALRLDSAACRAKALQFSWERSADAFIQNLVPRA